MPPQDLCVDKPDDQSVMTYIGYFCTVENSIGKTTLLKWINEKIPHEITGFTSEWKDGMALGCLADVVSGGKFPDYEDMTSDTPLENAEKSMEFAVSLGVPKVITPKQFIDHTLDPVKMMTYLTYFKFVKPSDDVLVGITASGPGVTGDKPFQETNFAIRGRIPDWAPLDISITAPDGSKVPFNKLDPVANSSVVHYKPPLSGNYTVEILVNKEHIRGSPFNLRHIEPPNPAGCTAYGEGLVKVILGETAEFTVDCTNGGDSQLSVDILGPSDYIRVDSTEKVSERVYSVKYTPVDAGPHTISCLWPNHHIDKSPYTVQVIDPKKCIASGAGLTNAAVNQPSIFQVETKGAGKSTLNININGPNGNVPVQVKKDGPHDYICSYSPTAKGEHNIDVEWGGIPITGSPFHVLSIIPADASKCVAKNLPKGKLRANKEVKFIVDTTNAGDGELKASGHGPSIPQKCNIRSLDSSSYEISFSPFEVGVLSVDVKFADENIPESPFKFLVNDPTKCHINASAISSSTYVIKQSVDFLVSAQFAGEGDVTAKVHGPKGEENFQIKDQGDSTYLIHFTPQVPGSHAIEILFDGELIPDVPVNFFVGAGSGADDVIVTEPAADRNGIFVVETPHEYKINSSNANDGELAATCVGVFTGYKPKLEIQDKGNRQYSVLLNTPKPDEYKLNITWSNDPVPGSPFTISVVDKPHPDRVVIRGPSFEVDQLPISFTADVRNAGSGELLASGRGQKVGNVPVNITQSEAGMYKLLLEGPQPDLYTVSIFWSDEHVPGSPFKINNIPPDAGKVIVTKPDSFSKSVRAIFRVDATDAGVGKLNAYCRAENSANLPVELDKPDPDVEKYRCIITPIREDVYHLSILWSDKDVPDSPFKIDLVPRVYADRVIVDDPVFSTADQPVSTKVDTTNAGPGNLTAKCNGDTTGFVPVAVAELENGKYKLTFTPSKEDTYSLHIYFDGHEVPRSPQTVPIHPILEEMIMIRNEPPESELTFADIIGEEVPDTNEKPPAEMYLLIGTPFHIDIDEPVPEKIPELEKIVPNEDVEKDFIATAKGDSNGVAQVNVTKEGKNAYSVDFNPTKPDRYILTLSYGDETIKSPIIIHYSTPVDAGKCSIFGLENISSYPMINEPLIFGVDATAAGKSDLRVTADGPRSDEPSDVNVEEDSDKPGIYHVTYIPTAAGEHRVDLQWGNNLIPGCPLVFKVVSGSAISGDKMYPYGTPVVLDLVADCKPRDLEVFAVLEGNDQKSKMKINKNGKGQYKLIFQPTTPGYYDVHALLKGGEVAGSPYQVYYAEPPNPSVIKVDVKPSDVAFVNCPIVFDIDPKNAGKGELLLRASFNKKSKSQASSDFVIVDNGNSTYTATYIPTLPVIHSFDVLFANELVPGFPVKINVIKKQPEINHVLSSDLNLLEINKFVNIYFKLPGGDSISSITASATGRTIKDVDVKLQEVEEGLYRAHFAPSFPDDYKLEVMYNNNPVEGSPFPLKVVDLGGFEPSKSIEDTINPPVVEAKRPFSIILPINQPTLLPNDLQVNVNGPPGSLITSAEVKGDTYGTFSASFAPDVPGDYMIHVTNSKEDTQVSGSPYKVVVKECQSDSGGTLNIIARGPGRLDVKLYDNKDGIYTCKFSPSIGGKYMVDVLWGNEHIGGSPYQLNFKRKRFNVINGLNLDAKNFHVDVPYSFKVQCDSELGDGVLEVFLKPSNAGKVKVSNLGSQTYQVIILPCEEGHHMLSVLYGGSHIMGSPYSVTFNEGGDASKCRIISNDVEQTDDGKDHVLFLVSAKGAGKGRLTAHLENNSGEREPVIIDPLEDDVYKIHFDLVDDMEYELTTTYDGNHIEGSPFKLLFADKPSDVCKAKGKGLTVSQIDKEAKFFVFTKGAGEGTVKVEILAIEGTEIFPHISDLGEGKYEVSYNPTKQGEYKVFVLWEDKNITDSPFTMNAFVPLQASNLKVVNPPSEAYLEAPIKIQVKPVEETDEQGVVMISAMSRQATIDGKVAKEPDGTYTCTLEPVLSGKYVVQITLNGDNIQGSPFMIGVSEPPKPQNVRAYGPGLEDGYIGQEGNFTLETADAGTGTLSVRVQGPKGAFKIDMRQHPDNERTILAHYHPKSVGTYIINVMWSGMHIRGSPFTVEMHEQDALISEEYV